MVGTETLHGFAALLTMPAVVVALNGHVVESAGTGTVLKWPYSRWRSRVMRPRLLDLPLSVTGSL